VEDRSTREATLGCPTLSSLAFERVGILRFGFRYDPDEWAPGIE